MTIKTIKWWVGDWAKRLGGDIGAKGPVCGGGRNDQGREFVYTVANPEGVRGVQTNPLLSLNYFIFMGNFRKN